LIPVDSPRFAAPSLRASASPPGARALCAAAILVSFGCRYRWPGPPESFPKTVVEGTILFDGRPLEAGWVTVFPMGPSLGDLAIGPIGAGGRYRIDHAPVGPLAIRVSLPKSMFQELARTNPALARRVHLFATPASPLRTMSRPNEPTRFDFDLVRNGVAPPSR
jgi:hypothetical protein